MNRGIFQSISESSVSKLLNQAALKPYSRKKWLNINEQDPEVFSRQFEAVCETYRDARQLSAERGVQTISTDEMTGLKALERNAPFSRCGSINRPATNPSPRGMVRRL